VAPEDVVRVEREMASHAAEFKLIEESHGNALHLTAVTGCLPSSRVPCRRNEELRPASIHPYKIRVIGEPGGEPGRYLGAIGM
jgi:hypothetical protein